MPSVQCRSSAKCQESDEFQVYSTSDQSEMNVNHDDEDTKTDIFFAKQRQVQQEMEIYR